MAVCAAKFKGSMLQTKRGACTKGEQRYDFSFRASLSNLKATIPSYAAILKISCPA